MKGKVREVFELTLQQHLFDATSDYEPSLFLRGFAKL